MSLFECQGWLGQTKSYRERWYRFIAPAGNYVGRVRIVQYKVKRRGPGARDEEHYWFDPVDSSEVRDEFGSYWFVNCYRIPTEERASIYRVTFRLEPFEVLNCTCKASVCYLQDGCECKHKAVIRDLAAKGVFKAKDLSELAAIGRVY